MGILETVIGGLLGGGASGGASPMGSILTSILTGGGQQGGVNRGGGYGGGLSGGLGGNLGGGGLGGGLGSLLEQFSNAGLGHVAQSWVGSGPNQSVSPEELQHVFGHQQVNDMAQQAGMPPGDFLSQLSQHLPSAVDGVTPHGRLPDEGSMSV